MSTAQQILSHLESYGLAEKGGNRYRFNSPFRVGADGMTCSLLLHDSEHGAWKDHKDEVGGSLYDLAKRLGIEPPQTPPEKEKDSKRTYSGLEDYAAAHGVNANVFEDAKWEETTRYNKRALAIPTRTGTRYRMLEGDTKFFSPNGYKACWYGLNSYVMRAVIGGQPLVYCNGEPSVVVAQSKLLAAVTVAGGGEKPIPTALMDELIAWLGDSRPRVIVALDSDAKGTSAALQVVEQFKGAGFDAKAVDLNLWNKGDLADFCKLHGADSPSAIEELPALDPAEPPAAYRRWFIGDKFDLLKIPPVEWLLEPFIPRNQVGVLFGQSNIGKSFIALDFALRLSQHHEVMYMIAEGEGGYAQRVLAWEKHHKTPSGKMKYCFGAVHLMEDEDFQSFLTVLEKEKPEFVVVDTVKKTLVGFDANSGRDVAIYVDRCDEIRKRVGCTVLLVHHTNKGGLQMTGSYNWMSDVDFVLKASDEDGLIALESDKDKNNPRFSAHYRRLLTVQIEHQGKLIESAVIVEAEKVVQSQTDPLTQNQRKVLDALANVFEGEAQLAELQDFLTEIPHKKTLWLVLTQLKKLGYVMQANRRKPYRLTESGSAAVGTVGTVGEPPKSFFENFSNPMPTTPTTPTTPTAALHNEEKDQLCKPGVGIGKSLTTDTLEEFALSLGAEIIELPGFDSVPGKKTPNHYDAGM